jgi:hypothetical protein
MKAAHLGDRDDAALGGRLELSRDGGVPLEREMRTRLVGYRDIVAQESQLGLDAFGSPERVLARHQPDELDEFPRNGGPAPARRPGGLPLSEEFEVFAMPADHGLGLPQHEGRPPVPGEFLFLVENQGFRPA